MIPFSKKTHPAREWICFCIPVPSVVKHAIRYLSVSQSYSEEVAASAQAWADNCVLAHGEPSTRMLNGRMSLYLSFFPLRFNLARQMPAPYTTPQKCVCVCVCEGSL